MAIAAIVLLTVSCKNKKNGAQKPTTSNTADTSKAFPIMDLLREDVEDVKKTPYYLYKKTATGDGGLYKDSVQVSREDFATMIAPILTINTSDSIHKNKFKEIAFHDLSTQSYSIITTPINNNAELKSITTLLNDETNKLKSIFFVMEKNIADSSTKTTYFWKAGKSLRISTSISANGKKITEKKEFINWNDIAE